MQCIPIDPAEVHKVWPLVTHFIEDAMKNGGGDFDLVQRDVLNGGKLLWVAAADRIWAAAVTGLHMEGAEKICVIWACGGHEKMRWLQLKDDLEIFARAEGCRSIRVYGRRGWSRELPDYKLINVTLEKVL